MMTVLKWILFFAAALAMQMTVMPSIALNDTIYPEALLIPLFILSIEHGRMAGIWAGFFTGLLADVLRGDYLGAQALAMTLVGAFVGLFSKKKFNAGPVVQIVIMIVASILHDIIYGYSIGHKLNLIENIQRAFYTALIAAVLLFISHFLHLNKRR